MLLHRISPVQFAADAWSGEGSWRHGARWNHRGCRVVYASQSLALAALEYFVNLAPDLMAVPVVACSALLPDDIPITYLDPAQLPPDWVHCPFPAFQDLGDRWVEEAKTLALRVPSAVIPDEWNVLLSPSHPQFRLFHVRRPVHFHFDPRMFRHH